MSLSINSISLGVVCLLSCSPSTWAQVMTPAAGSGAGVTFIKHVIDPVLPTICAAAVDVDGDGRLDIIAAGGPSGWHSEWANLVYWFKAPDWQRKPICRLDTNAVILHIEAVDFTNRHTKNQLANRSVEIVVTDGFLGDIWWFRYDCKSDTWSGSVMVKDIKFAHGTAGGDIDCDGYTDLLVPTQRMSPKEGLVWARNPGSSATRDKSWPTYPVSDTFLPCSHYVNLVDLNGDGRLDALHAASLDSGWFGFWLQGKDPFGKWEQHLLSGPMRQATNLDAADLNGDGRLDLVGTEGHGVGVWWFPAPDYQPVRVDDTLKSTHCLALGDYDGDGSTDIFTCGYDSRKAVCFLNDGKGQFRKVVVDEDQCAYDARAVDMDKDGDLDVLLSGQLSRNLVWYENQSAGGGDARPRP